MWPLKMSERPVGFAEGNRAISCGRPSNGRSAGTWRSLPGTPGPAGSAGPQPAGEIARAVGLAPPAMSRHLRTLRRSGLIEVSHPDFDARVRVYALKPQPMAELRGWLEETERMWSEQLVAFKAHLERDPA